MGVCFAAAGIVKMLSVAAFTLVWTHSIEKIEWQEDWHVTPQGLQIVTARVKGSGAGMEPPPEARLVNGWFQWSPSMAPLSEVVLGNSGLAGEWRLCTDQGCRTLSDVIGHPLGAQATVMTVCDKAPPKAAGGLKGEIAPSDGPLRKYAAIRHVPTSSLAGGLSIAPRSTAWEDRAAQSGSGVPMQIARFAAVLVRKPHTKAACEAGIKDCVRQ